MVAGHRCFKLFFAGCLLVACSLTCEERSSAQSLETQTIQAAGAVLNEAMASPGNQIPQSMLANAYGVAIIPKVIKGGFVVGARFGRGLLFVREADGIWHAPVFITLTGGNIGWQVGVQSSDIILVFKTLKSVQGILSGKLTIGADAAAAAGPLGRQGSVGTDGKLQAEIYSYSRSRGLFAGVSIDGSVLQVDSLSTGAYYRPLAPGQPVVVPPAAQALTQTVASITATAAVQPQNPTGQMQQPELASRYGVSESDMLRTQLAQVAPELFKSLDPQWQSYLALPMELVQAGPHPDAATLDTTLQRYNTVANDPRYRTLATFPEFQSVYGLLNHYRQSLSPSDGQLNLPPPPIAGAVLPQ